MSQHTPTPWEVIYDMRDGGGSGYPSRIVSKKEDEPTIVIGNNINGYASPNYGDAEFIVRAVNSHEALLELVKDWRKDLISGLETDGHEMPDMVFNMFKVRIMRIDKAIAQAEGK